MKNLHVSSITGFSASARKKAETLPDFLKDVFQGRDNTTFGNVYSSDHKCIQKLITDVLTCESERVLIVGKSLGGVRVWWALTEYWGHFQHLLNSGTKIGAVLLDPHGWQVGDGETGSYGMRLKHLGINPEWDRPDFRIKCVYQQNKYPKGCRLGWGGNAENVKLSRFANHWNITEIETLPGEQVATEIKKMEWWLNGK